MPQNPLSAETTSMAAGPSNAISVVVSVNQVDVGPAAHQVEAYGMATMQDDHDHAENIPGPAAKVRKRSKQPKAVQVRKSTRQR
jgi:hypothetical protein